MKKPIGQCPSCGQEFMSKLGLQRHMERGSCSDDGSEQVELMQELAEPPKKPENRWRRTAIGLGGQNTFVRR